MYAFGLLLWEMVAIEVPFDGTARQSLPNMSTWARANSWCLLIHAEASLSLLKLSLNRIRAVSAGPYSTGCCPATSRLRWWRKRSDRQGLTLVHLSAQPVTLFVTTQPPQVFHKKCF